MSSFFLRTTCRLFPVSFSLVSLASTSPNKARSLISHVLEGTEDAVCWAWDWEPAEAEAPDEPLKERVEGVGNVSE